MAKEEPIQLEGQVTEVLPNATFRVLLTNGHTMTIVAAYLRRRPDPSAPDQDRPRPAG